MTIEIANKFFKQKTINGNNYQISLLPALEGMRMARTLGKIVLPILGGTIDGMRSETSFEIPRTFSDLALVLCTQLDNIDFDETILKLVGNATCNGNVIDINEHFRGDMGSLIELLEFALRENFSSFFMGKGLLAQLQTLIATMGNGSEESQEQ